MNHQLVIVLDFGGQYNQLIARRVRECGVYCEVKPYTTPIAELKAMDPIGFIFTGGPNSVYEDAAPHVDPAIFELGIPVLGICYGCQLMAHTLGGQVTAAQEDTAREYGKTRTYYDTGCKIFQGLPAEGTSWMSHGDYMAMVPAGFALTAHSDNCPNVAIADASRGFYGVQFHPEVNHTENGTRMIRNFLFEVCGATGDWTMGNYCKSTVARLREEIGPRGRVLLALSGGVDSSVLAALLAEAIGDRLTCVFVDHGLMRKHEGDEVESAFSKWKVRFVRVNAEERFLSKLAGVEDPQEKRHIIGAEFGYVFRDEAEQFGITDQDFLAQGTIYPDVVESASASVKGPAAMIKSHHNVGGLPEEMHLKIVEPLRLLFKDEVRRVGKSLGIDPQLLGRHPFPGPGLAIRILGDITPEKVEILQNVDKIYIDALREWGLYDQVWQAGAILLPVKSVGVMGDERTYESCVALRAVASTDGMTADWVHLPYDFLAAVSNDIINKVRGVNRVVYDISSKPPATIEWE